MSHGLFGSGTGCCGPAVSYQTRCYGCLHDGSATFQYVKVCKVAKQCREHHDTCCLSTRNRRCNRGWMGQSVSSVCRKFQTAPSSFPTFHISPPPSSPHLPPIMRPTSLFRAAGNAAAGPSKRTVPAPIPTRPYQPANPSRPTTVPTRSPRKPSHAASARNAPSAANATGSPIRRTTAIGSNNKGLFQSYMGERDLARGKGTDSQICLREESCSSGRCWLDLRG